jgi:hypothetical protein
MIHASQRFVQERTKALDLTVAADHDAGAAARSGAAGARISACQAARARARRRAERRGTPGEISNWNRVRCKHRIGVSSREASF